MNWIPVSERMPEPETDCLVWSHPSWSKQPLAIVDRWGEQHEAPVAWSSATIPIGLGWDSSNFEDVTHWLPIKPPDSVPTPAALDAGNKGTDGGDASRRGEQR